MMSELLIMTWYWKQAENKCEYSASTVNTWAAMMRRHLTIPHRLVCVTDDPEGIEIETIPLPKDFDSIRSVAWSEEKGCPQCYRRITLFSPDAAQIFGAERFVSMDMDCVVTGNIDYLFERPEDFVMFRGTSGKRPYNGSMVMMTAGSRTDVYTRLMTEGQSLVEAAQHQYLGSDQAIISYVLGPGEAVWDQSDGVFFWSPKFKRNYRSRIPENMRLLFFPGHPKPWQALEYPYIRAHWHMGSPAQAPDKKPEYATMDLYAFNDKKGWGRRLYEAAKARGVVVKLFRSPFGVPPGAKVFLRMDQQGSMRRVSKVVAEKLAQRGCELYPSLQECRWYDDKILQHEALKKWMPATLVTDNRKEAAEWLEKNKPPFVSKLSHGASSKNVRLVADREEALALAASQKYVYWQKLIGGKDYDYRITIVGDHLFGLRRFVRAGDFRASGSGVFEHLTFESAEERKVAELALKISAELNVSWVAFDFVMSGKTPKVLEMSSSWHWESNANAPLFTHDLEPTKLHGKDCLKMALAMMRKV
jgi:hypothetical protein